MTIFGLTDAQSRKAQERAYERARLRRALRSLDKSRWYSRLEMRRTLLGDRPRLTPRAVKALHKAKWFETFSGHGKAVRRYWVYHGVPDAS